jgi:hypothetical protein
MPPISHTNNQECMPNNKGSATIIVLIIVLVLLGVGGYFGYTKFYLKRGALDTFTTDLVHISLKEEILHATYEQLPNVYFGLVKMNNELLVINKEIERLRDMEKKFPQQLDIISSEKTIWSSIEKNVSDTIGLLENEIETLYVAHKVNPEKGKKRIDGKEKQLQGTINKILEETQLKTQRLKDIQAKKSS